MPHMMSQASVLLLTLTARPIFALTVPNKTQAYLAIGKPIIAAINGEVSKIITDAKAGIAVSAEDSDALALAIVRMYKLTESERMQMGLNAKLYFLQNFEQSLIANKMVNHFTNVVRGKI
jgi:glycosyltransferase involved in cell wall biosynthesis